MFQRNRIGLTRSFAFTSNRSRRRLINQAYRVAYVSSHVRHHLERQRRESESHSGIARHANLKVTMDTYVQAVKSRSDAESWQIQVVFGYVFNPTKADIDELLACKDTSFSFPCLGKLNDIAKILAVGNMVVEVRSR